MAVTKSLNRPPEIKEEVKTSSVDCKNAIPPGIFGLRKFNGALTEHANISEGTSSHVHFHGNSNATELDESESLSDIDDAEVTGYLNTKQQMHYKRILWETINREFSKAKKPKQKAKLEQCVSVERATRITKKIEKKRPSAKINYDALRKLADELNQGLENADQEGVTGGDIISKRMDEPST